jgi:FOG: TPR repeat, SEL1 subfamily
MNYPSISDYIEALRDAEDSLSELKDLRLVYDDQGHPIMSSGNFAVVFKMQAPTGEYHALKCFLRDQEERSERYRMIAEELQYVQSTYLVKFRYLESELFVDVPNTGGEEYPVLLMDWVDGIPLDQYLKTIRNETIINKTIINKTIINNGYGKDLLAYRFSLLARWLVTQPFAHGDLKPDNICVRDDGSLVLLDYDGMYVPALSGRKPLEQGSPHYRHPLRSTLPFDEHIDDYSLSLILLSLRAIALDETLYVRYSSSEYLLLSEQDQLNPYTSPVFKELNRLVLSLDFIDSYHTYLKSLHDTTYYLEARNLQLLAPILMYRRGAEAGDPQGMYKLGVCYNFGEGGLTEDDAKAVELYQKAAEGGTATAMFNLGFFYEYGKGGLTKDMVKAAEWYRKAAEAGNATAMYELGNYYFKGQVGLTKDDVQAVAWYRKAAEAGNAKAMFELGFCYAYGRGGLTKDEAKGREWCKKAVEAE